MINGLVDSIHQFQNQASAVIEDIHAGSWEGHEVRKNAEDNEGLPQGKSTEGESYRAGEQDEPRLPISSASPPRSTYAIISSMRSGGPEYGGRDGVVEPTRSTGGTLCSTPDSKFEEAGDPLEKEKGREDLAFKRLSTGYRNTREMSERSNERGVEGPNQGPEGMQHGSTTAR
ncbi:hypothetical protein PPACK8108_LOCUS9824 [Phakopsora pachyrhizi]|uniref:Uncharacterized protein n=1 Tax=Phakopsora pachyrhizi TaxID=170000 RepID=A0AAV0B257_PHAPC|nr:hypothetical protein PPACK8108_LOCUS9824 [Phakopsora pachyrhizi]